MSKLRAFLKRNFLWVGLVAVIIPLFTLLVLQYRSLDALEQTMPIARKEYMRRYLVVVAKDIFDYYQNIADQALTLSAKAFVSSDGINDALIVEHFNKFQTKAVKRFFVGAVVKAHGDDTPMIYFYNPTTWKMETDKGSEQWEASHTAFSVWLVHILASIAPGSTSLTVEERDPDNRVIVKPIINDSGKVVGVAGMIIDEAYFRETILPQVVRKEGEQFFTEEFSDVIVTAFDKEEKILFTNAAFEGHAYEVSGSLPVIYKDWRLGIRMRQMTEDQWARRAFVFNLSLTILMTLLLIGGIIAVLRSASREMKLSQMKSDFVSNVSHELRTPLASIRVFGEFFKLGRVRDHEKAREYGEYIETESRRLTQLINNILDFSKIESGRKTYEFERTNIKEVIGDVLKTYEVHLSQNGFHIIFEAPPDALPLPAVIDANAMATAFMNLLDNAVKYSGESREVLVKLGRVDDYITISVTDYGIGIAREDRDKIFEKFYRVSTGLVHDVKGSGLGLSIVKHIVEAHRGLLTLNSKPGAGSTFSIHIPLDRSAAPENKPTEKAKITVQSHEVSLESKV